MKATRLYGTVVFLAIILCAASLVRARFAQSQPASSGWRQFGVSDSPPEAATSDSGWRLFGAVDVAPKIMASDRPTRSEVASRGVTSGSVAALERQMYELINRDRLDPANAAETGGRAQPLRWNGKLAVVARAHSEDMLMNSFFDHVDREGGSPATRVKAAGIDWQAVGENIAIYENVESAQRAFMNEPRFGHNHRSNILSSKYTEVGVGIVKAPDGRYYITQDFIKPPESLQQAFAGASGAGLCLCVTNPRPGRPCHTRLTPHGTAGTRPGNRLIPFSPTPEAASPYPAGGRHENHRET